MTPAEILGVSAIRFIEPAYADLPSTAYTDLLARLPCDEARLLIDEHDEPLALAFHDGGSWTAGSFICRKPSVSVLEHFEEVNGEIYREERRVWVAAVRGEYSRQLAGRVVPAIDDLNKARPAIIEDLIGRIWGRGSGQACLDFCCGSGVGSDALRRLGYTPLSCDNDEALISRGLASGRLVPEETICIDATRAAEYIDPMPRAIGIMMGEINMHSQELWQELVSRILELADDVVITVGTQEEANLIRTWGEVLGRSIGISENPADPMYDRWVCTSCRK